MTVTVDALDLKYALASMALSGCMCSEGNDGTCVCDYSQRKDHQVLHRLHRALPREIRDA